MEVLQSIINYVEDMKRSPYVYENQKGALDMLYRYCVHTEPQLSLCDIDADFFDEFLMYWLPTNETRLREREIYQILKGVGDYCNHIQSIYDIPSLEKYEVIKAYGGECLRIYQLRNLFSKYLGDPILNVAPFVVDFSAYKKYKIRKNINEGQGVYQQGLFEVVEIDYDSTIVLRRLSKGTSIRVIAVDSLVIYMRRGDILHLRIKQKQFFACWEIQEIRSCYLPNAGQYLIN